MADGPNIPWWLAWVPGISAGMLLIVPIVRKVGAWFSSRSSREEVAALVAGAEQRWAQSFAGIAETRQQMHGENQQLLRDIDARLGSLEQKVAGIDGELRAQRRR